MTAKLELKQNPADAKAIATLRAEIDSLRAKIVELSVVTVCCEHCGTVSEYRRLPEKSPRE